MAGNKLLILVEAQSTWTMNIIIRALEVSLSEEFFDREDCCIDVKVKMIYDGKEGDIINQYVVFTKVCSKQISIHGRTRRAILEAIHICKNKNVLKLVLENGAGGSIDAVYFGDIEAFLTFLREKSSPGQVEALLHGAPQQIRFSMTYDPSVDTYLGQEKVQVIIRHYR